MIPATLKMVSTTAHLLRVVRNMRVCLDQSGQTAVCQAANDRHQRVEIIQLSQPLYSHTHRHTRTVRLLLKSFAYRIKQLYTDVRKIKNVV